MEIGNAILREEADEVEALDGILAWRRWKDGAAPW